MRPPDAKELLDVGYRTPEQTFATFQVGWRAEEPDLERLCFSRDFRERHQVSRFNYRVFRERLVSDQPFLRLGIADAKIAGPAEIRGARARLVAKSHGRTIELELVRDDVIEVWSADRRVVDRYDSFDDHTQTRASDAGVELLWAHVELPENTDASSISEIHLAREWKIDDLRLIDAETTKRP